VFTGLIEGVGRIAEVSPRGGSTRIGVVSSLPADGTDPGASVAVDGVCLTVARRRADRFYADVVAETLSRSTLGGVRAGHAVNLERSLRLGDPLGGHLVLGHVDRTVGVLGIVRRGDDYRLRLELPRELARYVAVKGSIAVQGVSLTVSACGENGFEVALVPQTLGRTTLGSARRGDRINVEVDLLARYLERLVRDTAQAPGRPEWGEL
jgi:riboflavin synthase